MATTKAVTATGNRHVDGLIEGRAWLGTASFSFPDARSDFEAFYGNGEASAGFAQLSLAAMQVARAALLGGSSVPGGNAVLRGMGVAQFTNLDIVDSGFDGADIRLAQSTLPPTAYARMPAAGAGGDIWFGTAYDYRNPVLGNYAYHTILHELGHALGLKHAHEGGGVANAAVPLDRDGIEFTLMSYRSTIAGSTFGYTYESWSAPQSFMMLDIAALQAMYGADFTAHGGDTTYRWNPLTGEMAINGIGQGTPGGNRIFLTIWDGGGRDTYDLSDYSSGVTVDLTPGGWSVASKAQLALLAAGKQARGNVFNALQYQGDARSLIEDAIGTSGHDRILGNQADNHLRGGGGNDTLVGSAGADTLDGGSGADSLSGGMGDDVYILGTGKTVIVELSNQGDDTVHAAHTFTLGTSLEALVLTGTDAINGTGNAAANRLTGNDAANRLSGGGGSDWIDGAGGADTLEGGAGADTLIGGSGDDTYIVATVTQLTIEAPDDGFDTVLASIGWTLGDRLENLSLLGSTGIAGSGNALDNRIIGNGGANRLNGGAGDDTLDGGAGADTLDGGTGEDLMRGGTGNDTYIIADPGDIAIELPGGGTDLVMSSITWKMGAEVERLRLSGSDDVGGTGNALANTLWGNAGANRLRGGDGVDTLDGGAGADTLDGGAGADSMAGGLGDDTYILDVAGDRIIEATNAGIDTVIASVSITLGTHIEKLVLAGDAGVTGTGNTLANAITGNAGANLLLGAAGADTLSGGAGNDTLQGGIGADLLEGGAGADAFRFAGASEGGDIILDFDSGEDWIALSAASFGGGLTRGTDLVASGRLHLDEAGTALGSMAQFLFDTARALLFFDSNGAGAGGTVLLADFQGASVRAGDFVLIA